MIEVGMEKVLHIWDVFEMDTNIRIIHMVPASPPASQTTLFSPSPPVTFSFQFCALFCFTAFNWERELSGLGDKSICWMEQLRQREESKIVLISYLNNWWMMVPFTEIGNSKQRTDLGIREFIVEFRDFGRTLWVKMFSVVSRLKILLTSHPECFLVCI